MRIVEIVTPGMQPSEQPQQTEDTEAVKATKAAAEAIEKQKKADEEDDEKITSWMATLRREKKETGIRKKKEEEARARRLARLFEFTKDDNSEEESEDEEFIQASMDRKAADTGISHLLDRVDVHLQVEKNILNKWNVKDQVTLGKKGAAPSLFMPQPATIVEAPTEEATAVKAVPSS